jgi:hypothetical protein
MIGSAVKDLLKSMYSDITGDVKCQHCLERNIEAHYEDKIYSVTSFEVAVLLLRTYVKKFIPSQKYCIFNDD